MRVSCGEEGEGRWEKRREGNGGGCTVCELYVKLLVVVIEKTAVDETG